jgi:hypothetical protein
MCYRESVRWKPWSGINNQWHILWINTAIRVSYSIILYLRYLRPPIPAPTMMISIFSDEEREGGDVWKGFE